MRRAPASPEILVLAGTNGAGKSSIAGAALRLAGGELFDPDAAARRFVARHPHLSPDEASSRAWRLGRRLLTRAIRERLRFAFETTLGGRTMTGLLLEATAAGIPVRIWYVGLASVELHVERVRARVLRGGHAIPDRRIRQRYDASRRNLIHLLPHLEELKLFDNSPHRDPLAGEPPEPKMVLHLKSGRVLGACPMAEVPVWAKPIVRAAIRLYGGAGRG
ncbi:MAG TPA: zeta toxin family protein [Thermoanaerobaculia bacterium]|nr:zeta toxin family protein [Thermoanaerobaculia bacterium]